MDYTIDARQRPLGRLASEIATILQGKKNPKYHPRLPGEDRALLKNYREIVLTGRKEIQKTYYRHTGYVGHLKETRFKEAFAKDPKRVIREAVRHMLPKNRLAVPRLKRLMFVESEKQ